MTTRAMAVVLFLEIGVCCGPSVTCEDGCREHPATGNTALSDDLVGNLRWKWLLLAITDFYYSPTELRI